MNTGENVKFVIQCEVCEKDVKAKRKTRRFCSNKCVSHRHSWKYKEGQEHLPVLLRSVGHKKKKGEIRKCLECGKDTYVLPTFVRSTKHSFCCKEHMYLYNKKKRSLGLTIACKVCSVSVPVTPSILRWRPRKTCSKDCLKIYRRSLAIERRKSYTKHQLDRLARYSPEAETWRKNVFKRDDFTCQTCFVRGGKLEADHIKPWAYFPELRYELSNGRTLCRVCHDKTKMSAKEMRKKWNINSSV